MMPSRTINVLGVNHVEHMHARVTLEACKWYRENRSLNDSPTEYTVWKNGEAILSTIDFREALQCYTNHLINEGG